MERLRATVERLEVTYHEMEAAVDIATATRAQQTSTRRDATARPSAGPSLSTQYSELISATSQLKDENFRLKRALDDKHRLQETLERVYTDCLPSPPVGQLLLLRSMLLSVLTVSLTYTGRRRTTTARTALRRQD